jgi:hypothetical protein
MFVRIIRLSVEEEQKELGLFDLNYQPEGHTIINYKGEIYGIAFTSLFSSVADEKAITTYVVKIGTGKVARVIDLDLQPQLDKI